MDTPHKRTKINTHHHHPALPVSFSMPPWLVVSTALAHVQHDVAFPGHAPSAMSDDGICRRKRQREGPYIWPPVRDSLVGATE